MSFWDDKLKVVQLLIISNTINIQPTNKFTMNYRAVTYGVKWIKEKKNMWVASLFNGKEKVKTKTHNTN